MDELLKFLMASGLMTSGFEDVVKSASKENLKNVDVSKIKEQMNQKSIDEGVAQIKKLYDSFVKVGFSEVQAFELVKVQLSSMRISR